MGVPPGLKILTLFQTKNCQFPPAFLDRASMKFCHHYLDKIERQQKDLFRSISNSHLTLSFYSFRIKTTNSSYTPVVP